MPVKNIIVAFFILRKIKEECIAKQKKVNMCFVDVDKSFDGVLRNVVQWELRKRAMPETLVRSVLTLHRGGSKTVKVEKHLSEEFQVNVGVSVLTPLMFSIVIDVVTSKIKVGTLQ